MSVATAVASHLNVAESLITEVQEWAHVLWVRFTSGRPQFVSKKVKMMHKITCTRSGLTFEAETRRLRVHPKISYYTAHKDTDIRYPAIKVVERGKTEGWESIEVFESEIEKALNPPPKPPTPYHLECAWVAKITGYHPKFDYDRIFLEEVSTSGRFKRFLLTEPGLYQSCYKSAKGNETRQWWLAESANSYHEIKIDQVIEILGEKPEKPQSSDPLTLATKKVVEECWECGATYTTYGNVEAGNMCCKRCA